MTVINTTSLQDFETLKMSKDGDGIQIGMAVFNLSGTYAQADGARITGLGALITARRRNGLTATLLTAGPALEATKASDPTQVMYLSDVAISGDDVTFKIQDEAYTGAELADATAVPSQSKPFSLLVTFTESA